MARSVAFGILVSLLIAACVSVAGITPISDRPVSVQRATVAICYLDWPISKATGRVDMGWQGLALFAENPGCRGISPDMPRIFALQGFWSTIVYGPLFGAVSLFARRRRRRQAR